MGIAALNPSYGTTHRNPAYDSSYTRRPGL